MFSMHCRRLLSPSQNKSRFLLLENNIFFVIVWMYVNFLWISLLLFFGYNVCIDVRIVCVILLRLQLRLVTLSLLLF